LPGFLLKTFVVFFPSTYLIFKFFFIKIFIILSKKKNNNRKPDENSLQYDQHIRHKNRIT